MFICRLFHVERPFEQLEMRTLDEGEITIGRDPAVDWPLTDPDGGLSRVHCKLSVEKGRIVLVDCSTNGTFLHNGDRAPAHSAVELLPGRSIHLGRLSIHIDWTSLTNGDDATAALEPVASARQPAHPWLDGGPADTAASEASLLDAFFESAKLDSSAFASEDPNELMRSIGAIYRETVIGLAALLAERAKFKADHELDRTTISATANNPFKWAASRKLAQDLLINRQAGFLSGGEAIGASFNNLNEHLRHMSAIGTAATTLIVDRFDPADIEREARTASGSFLRSHTGVCWEIHNRRHAELAAGCNRSDGLKDLLVKAYARAVDADLP